MEYFKRELGDYTTSMNPVNNYLKQAVDFVSIYKGVSEEEALTVVKSTIKNKSPKDPMVTYKTRLDNGDRGTESCKLTTYIKDTIKDNDIITPSLTVYDHPSKNKSLHADFLKINITKRKKHKNLSFEAYQNGDINGYIHNDVLQKVMKIFNNSLSGAYASKSTALYNPSQHYTLTSITRSVASIGNSVTESIVAGNKCLYTPDSVINYITAVVSTVNLKTIATVMRMYNIKYPTVEETITMLRYSSDRYWFDSSVYDTVAKYLKNMDKYQLAAVMYVNDLYHLRAHNADMVKEFVGALAARVPAGVSDPLKALKINVEGINNLVHHICMEDIRGMKVDYDKLKVDNPDVLMVLGSTADNVYRVLDKYRMLI
ncbi:MAG: hypothetical protein Q9M19_01025, partial [Mariprofundaceae bacterium]|nr:hypothetical protein [Mariprofundaceae bacterium]